MNVFLDTSVILRVFLNQKDSFSLWGKWDKAFVSELARIEFFRTIDRFRMEGHLSDEERSQLTRNFQKLWLSCFKVPLQSAILERASGSFPTVIKTLDAIHLASALAVMGTYDEDILFVTHDRQLSVAASALDIPLAIPL
jgi:predicted nucleic acid-binding protein